MAMTTLESKIESIVLDRTHGSSVLLEHIIQSLTDPRLTKEELQWAFERLETIDPSMVIIHHFIREMKPKIDRNFQKQLHQYDKKWHNVEGRIADSVTERLHRQKLWILTHSYSGTVIGILKILMLKGYELRVIQTESYPGGEGVNQAMDLKHLGISVQLVKDDNMRSYIMDVDAVLLGMDQYDRSSFVNKQGSKRIVETAERFDIPVFVLGDSRKKVPVVSTSGSSFFERVRLKNNINLITEKSGRPEYELSLIF